MKAKLSSGLEVAKAAVALPKQTAVGFFRGLTYSFKGLRFILRKPELIRFWGPPIVITLACLGLVTWLALANYDTLVTWVWAEPTGEGFWVSVAHVLHKVVEVLVAILLVVVGAVAVSALSSVIAAPFNDVLSEEVERLMTGREGPPFSFKALLRDTLRTIGLETMKLLFYVGIMGPLFVVSSFVPGVGHAIYSVFAFLFTAMYFAVDYVDWPASRRNKSTLWRFGLAQKHAMPMLGFGTGVWLFLFLPFLNLFFMPAAVAGGTLLFLDLEGGSAQPGTQASPKQ